MTLLARWCAHVMLGCLLMGGVVLAQVQPARATEPGPLVVKAYLAPYEPTSANNFAVRVWVALENPAPQGAVVQVAEMRILTGGGEPIQVERLGVAGLAAGEGKKLPPVYFPNDSRFEVIIHVVLKYTLGGKEYQHVVLLDRHHGAVPPGFSPDW